MLKRKHEIPEPLKQLSRRFTLNAAAVEKQIEANEERKRELRAKRGQWEARRKELSHPQYANKLFKEVRQENGTVLREPTGELAEIDAEIQKCTEEILELDRENSELSKVRWDNTRIDIETKDYLKKLKSTAVFDKRTPPKLKAGETSGTAIQARADKREACEREIKQVEKIHHRSADMLKSGMLRLDKLEADGNASLNGLAAPGSTGDIGWPIIGPPHATRPYPVNTLAVTVNVFRPHFDAWLKKAVAAHVEIHGEGISESEQRSRIEKLRAEILDLDYEIEALIRQIETEGGTYPRNPKADVRARLGLAPAMPPLGGK